MSRPLTPNNSTSSATDLVFTPEPLAKAIINHFQPAGAILDPCKGKGAFYNNFPDNVWNSWCEITEGRDFLTYKEFGWKFDYTISNFPWSKMRVFLKRSYEISDNVISLMLVNAIFMKARLRDMNEAGFGIKEILLVDEPKEKEWPKTGFQLGAIHIQRGYKGDIKFSKL